MGKFVYVYKGGKMADTEEERNAAMAAWGGWLGGFGESMIDGGAPFGNSASVTGSGSNGAGASGLGGYSIVSAASLDDAVAKAAGCPVFAAGGDVEVYEALEM